MTEREDRPDRWRGFSTFRENEGGESIDIHKLDLCPGALVYSFTLSVRAVLDGDAVPNDLIGAVLRLQDSTIEVPMHGCRVASISGDFSKGTDGGLRFPMFAQLETAPLCNASLVISYGHCSQ